MIPSVESERVDGVTVLRADLPVDRTVTMGSQVSV